MPTTKRTVIGKGYSNIKDEKAAVGAIVPGMLVERTSADKVQAHATADGIAQKLFAQEDSYQGNGLADNYAADDIVILFLPTAGERVNAIASATTGTVIAIGDFLVSDGTGRLKLADESVADGLAVNLHSVIGVAVEAAAAGERFTLEII
jgi:hypothetical protein